MTVNEAMQEIGEIPFTNSLHQYIFNLLKNGKGYEAVFHYRKAIESGCWLLSDEESAKHRSKRTNKRNKERYGKGYSNIRNYKLSLYKTQKYRCAICMEKKPISNLEIDHILQVKLGGTNDIENLQLLCKECHFEKDKELINLPYEKQIVMEN